jgi:GH25 family lysozyme M1 (1,4-beta-N-acetylmuramidase)
MSDRTLRLTSPHMHGDDVAGFQRDLNTRLDAWHVPHQVDVDGDYGIDSRDTAKSVLYGLGVDDGGDFDGVSPSDRIKVRHGFDALTDDEKTRNRERAAWRKRYAKRLSDNKPAGHAHGIDVSNNNGHVDWAKIADAGYRFAWAKASEGATFNDAFLLENVKAARAHGITPGAYHFLRPGSPVGQAWHFAGRVRAAGLGKGDLRPVVDVEVPGATPALAGEFVAEVHRELGVRPLIYTFPAFAHWSSTFGCGLWIAHFGVSHPTIPPPWKDYTAWQHSSTASVPGVSGNCDVNVTDDIGELIW